MTSESNQHRLVSARVLGVADARDDSAYRSARNEHWLARNMLTSRIHRRKPNPT